MTDVADPAGTATAAPPTPTPGAARSAPRPSQPSPWTTPSPSARSLGDRLQPVRRWSRTTPGRLRLLSLAVVAATVVLALLATTAIASRKAAVDRIGERLEPLVVRSVDAHAAIVEADAAAAAAFLSGGVEDPDARLQYEDSIDAAARSLVAAAALAEGDAVQSGAVEEAALALPRYTGLVEQARANNRQGFPIGAAYLRAASTVANEEMVPALERLSADADDGVRDAYDDRRRVDLVTISLLGLVLVALAVVLLLTHRFLARRTRRLLNVPLALATVGLVGLVVVVVGALVRSTDGLDDARKDGYELLGVAARARTIGFDARADEILGLIARGNGAGFRAEHEAGQRAMAGVLGEADSLADTSSGVSSLQVRDLEDGWAGYLSAYRAVEALAADGDQTGASTAALTDSADAFRGFDEVVQDVVDEEEADFDRQIDRADSALDRLWFLLPAAIVLALLALYGVQQRIDEYR